MLTPTAAVCGLVASGACYVPVAVHLARTRPVCASLSDDYLQSSVAPKQGAADVTVAATEVKDLLSDELWQELEETDVPPPLEVASAASDVLELLEEPELVAVEAAAPPAPKKTVGNDEAAIQAQADLVKAGEALGKLAIAMTMAAAHTLAAVSIEAGKTLGSSTWKAFWARVFGIFGGIFKGGAKAAVAPPPVKPRVTAPAPFKTKMPFLSFLGGKAKATTPAVAAPEPVLKEEGPPPVIDEGFAAAPAAGGFSLSQVWPFSVRGSGAKPVDVSLKASAERLKEAAALEMEAKMLALEASAMEKATADVTYVKEGYEAKVAAVKSFPRRLRERAVAQVQGGVSAVEVELARKRAKTRELAVEVDDSNKRLLAHMPSVLQEALTRPPPPKPLTAWEKLLGKKPLPPPKTPMESLLGQWQAMGLQAQAQAKALVPKAAAVTAVAKAKAQKKASVPKKVLPKKRAGVPPTKKRVPAKAMKAKAAPVAKRFGFF